MANNYPVTEEDFLKKRDVKDPLTHQMRDNMKKLLDKVNQLLLMYGGIYYGVSSGYRPASINAAVGGAKKSAHMECQAIDLRDPKGALAKWCEEHQKHLVDLGLYLESPAHTSGWCHLQIRPTKSGKHVFLP